jgi:microsomal dipeptidase-like Zn-dependent dipeptidase
MKFRITTDNITIVAIAELWPVSSWFSLKERALYLAKKLHGFAERSEGKLYIIRTADDLAKFRERRIKEPDIVGGVLGIEGTQVLEGDPKNIEAIFDAGYRVIGLTHFFDNEMAGSMHGMQKGGLIGIGFWEEAIGPITDLKATVRAIRYAVKVAGIDSIALGSDSDGSVPMPFESSGMVLLTDALMKEGFSKADIRKIMGENQAAFYKKMLP